MSVAGLTGLVAFVVARRTREIAICVALGARPRHVLRLAVGRAMAATLVGLAAGLLAGGWLSKAFESLLYGVHAGDWPTIAGAALVMLVVAGVAAGIPAGRALGLSPARALRVE